MLTEYGIRVETIRTEISIKVAVVMGDDCQPGEPPIVFKPRISAKRDVPTRAINRWRTWVDPLFSAAYLLQGMGMVNLLPRKLNIHTSEDLA